MSTPTPDPTSAESTAEFAYALNRAIRGTGLTLERLRARLAAAGTPVSVATLSYWQTGRSLPTRVASLQVVTELESILGLPDGTLTELATDQRRRRRHDLQDWEHLVPSPDIVARVIDDMGLAPGEVTRMTVHDISMVDAERAETEQLTRQVLRGERSGADRWSVVFEQDAAAPGIVPQLSPVSGCSLGETVVVPERNLLIAEMLLPRPLERGELAMVEMLVSWGPYEQPSYRLERSCVAPLRELVIEVRFDPAARPRAVTAYHRPQMDGAGEVETAELPLHRGVVQSIRHDAPSGVHGVRWEWE